MTTIVEISDTEDADDCVIVSDATNMDVEPELTLYHEACEENQLLADFIKECLKLDNSIGMQKMLMGQLLKHYHAADKTVRESSRIQKNLRRAINLIKTEPSNKYSHIKDLCDILKAAKFKKKVPFVTLTTNLIDNNCKPNQIKRCNTEELDVNNGTCKKAKLDIEDKTLDEVSGSQESSVTEEDGLLVPKKDSSIAPTGKEKKLQCIERKISYYEQRIAELDEQEVEDDSINSAYIKCERLKRKVLSLYKERCQLIGSSPTKHKRIRLKLFKGRPPGPTKALERFLNRNCNKYGDPPFPDFCDVVTCVTEANEKDDLGWTKSQILYEASTLFTLCGQSLQKRRQNREYRDLLETVKSEDLERDPADSDPELLAKLKRNKRIAEKKESEILERYTRLQFTAPKSKSPKNHTTTESPRDGETGDVSNEDGERVEELVNSNHDTDTILSKVDVSEERNEGIFLKSSDKLNVDNISDSLKSSKPMDLDNDKISLSLCAFGYCSDIKVGGCDKTTRNKVISKGAGHITGLTKKDNSICINNNDLKANKLNVDKTQICNVNSIESQVNHNFDNDPTEMLNKMGDNYTISVEILNDSVDESV